MRLKNYDFHGKKISSQLNFKILAHFNRKK